MLATAYKYRLHFLPFILFIGYLLSVRIKMIFSYSVDIGGLEYYFIHLVQQVLSGQPLYPNPETYPYANCLYTPVYIYLFSSIVWLSKINIYDQLHELLIAGRIFSLLLLFLQLFYLKKLASLLNASAFHFIIALTIYLLLLTGFIFATRPDGLKVLFFTMFLYHLLLYVFYHPTTRNFILSTAAAVLAVYTKQDITTVILLCFAVLFYYTRKKGILVLFLAFTGCCLLFFALCTLLFGKYVFANLILFNLQSVSGILSSYNLLFILLSIARTLPLLLLALWNLKKIRNSATPFTVQKFIVILSLAYYPVVHLSMLRAGANLNYTFELLIFLILNLLIFLKEEKDAIFQKKELSAILLAGYVLFLFAASFILQVYVFTDHKENAWKEKYMDILNDRNEVIQLIQSDTVFFPNTKYSIFYFKEHVVLGHDMHLDRLINLSSPVYLKESRLTFIDTRPYDENFKNGRIKYIIVTDNKRSIEHVRRYYPFYLLYKETGHMLIYIFNPTLQNK